MIRVLMGKVVGKFAVDHRNGAVFGQYLNTSPLSEAWNGSVNVRLPGSELAALLIIAKIYAEP